jgi:glycosyltransferase involved in cell wall biosynthesis
MQKFACIFSFKMSNWVSCQKIVFNLHKSYQLNPKLELLNFNFSHSQTSGEIVETAQAIVMARPDALVILDHQPHPLPLLQIVLPMLGTKKPRIIFHVFGDFTLFYAQWDKLAQLLRGYEVDFIVASDRQKHLLDKFLPTPLSAHVCPFPVDPHEFSYNPALRKLQRQEWGLKENDFAYVYTGRLSRQKRTHTLLRSFSDFLEKSKSTNAHLFLYGNTDHIGDQFVGIWETEGEYFRKINRIYKSFSAEVQARIHFMGSVPNAELKTVYQGADMLVNLSVHNDEDFGMSVAEAQCSGLPSILTDWGGLASFQHESLPEVTTFIPVKIGEKSKLIHYGKILQAFDKTFEKGHLKNRREISEVALARFSVEASSKTLAKIIKKDPNSFTGFSSFFEKVLRHVIFANAPYLTESKTINKLYREIYSSYVRNP